MAKIIPVQNLDKKAIIDAYNQGVIDLTAIQNNTVSTNAKLLANQKLLATYLLKLAKFIKGQI